LCPNNEHVIVSAHTVISCWKDSNGTDSITTQQM